MCLSTCCLLIARKLRVVLDESHGVLAAVGLVHPSSSSCARLRTWLIGRKHIIYFGSGRFLYAFHSYFFGCSFHCSCVLQCLITFGKGFTGLLVHFSQLIQHGNYHFK